MIKEFNVLTEEFDRKMDALVKRHSILIDDPDFVRAWNIMTDAYNLVNKDDIN